MLLDRKANKMQRLQKKQSWLVHLALERIPDSDGYL
jgi:hypothetical protein